MVFDEPRLPGVPGAGWLWHAFTECRRETAYARPVDLSSSLIVSSQPDPKGAFAMRDTWT